MPSSYKVHPSEHQSHSWTINSTPLNTNLIHYYQLQLWVATPLRYAYCILSLVVRTSHEFHVHLSQYLCAHYSQNQLQLRLDVSSFFCLLGNILSMQNLFYIALSHVNLEFQTSMSTKKNSSICFKLSRTPIMTASQFVNGYALTPQLTKSMA